MNRKFYIVIDFILAIVAIVIYLFGVMPLTHPMLEKPVLYLYPEEEKNVKVSFGNNNLLTTTYPKFENIWDVKVLPNGDIFDKDGNYYYALYWEEKPLDNCDFKEGFYVNKNNAIEFLEEKLNLIGLNDRERNEFIMYWLPVLENNEHNLVYFELTEEKQLKNKLIIEPKPDSLLRLTMHVKKGNKKIEIPEQELISFKREGFVAVEWGGRKY